ncbi:Ankyrin repeat-containing domain protein [Lactarius tabidus]
MASSMGLAESVRLLIEHGADVTAQNETHLTPLHLASTWQEYDHGAHEPDRCVSKVETVRLLIENGADVITKDDACSTPLHLASAQGSVEIVRLLLQHGADITAQDGSLRTPLHLALSWRLCDY